MSPWVGGKNRGTNAFDHPPTATKPRNSTRMGSKVAKARPLHDPTVTARRFTIAVAQCMTDMSERQRATEDARG